MDFFTVTNSTSPMYASNSTITTYRTFKDYFVSVSKDNTVNSELSMLQQLPLSELFLNLSIFHSEYLEDSTHIKQYFYLAQQPESYQRRSYLNSKRPERRRFKPPLITLLPQPEYKNHIHYGTATMKIVNEDLEYVDQDYPTICELNTNGKSFHFSPIVASETSKRRYYRLKFVLNFLLDTGEQKSQTIISNKFRVVARISPKHIESQ